MFQVCADIAVTESPMCLYVAVPDAPRSVEVLSSLPTEILVSVQPPDEDGGMPVTGYRVEFEDQAQDFDLGKLLSLLSLAYFIWVNRWQTAKFVRYVTPDRWADGWDLY